MPAQWVLVHDQGSIDLGADELRSGGVVLAGPVGVGKTELADALAARFGSHTTRVVGTASARSVPLGAFAHVIEIEDAGTPATLLRAARASLQGDDRVIVVDDAHHLDKLSATLVYQLAVNRAARLIVTVDSDAPAPDAVAALWTDGLLSRHDVAPLDRDRTARVLEAAAGHPVEPGILDAVFASSRGNPLYLRHVILNEPAADLPTLVTAYVAALPEPAQQVLRYLAVGDPLTADDLTTLVGDDAVATAETANAVRVEGTVVRPAHPLYTDRVRAALSDDEVRGLRTSLVDQLAAPSDVVGRLRVAVLALDSDAPQSVDAEVSAAAEALRLGDLELAERLARAALHRSDMLAARLSLAYALGWQGRGREADEVLSAVDPTSLSDTELMAWALPRAANKFFMMSQPTQATAFLATARNRVSAPAAGATLDALTATFAMNAGTPLRALRIAQEVLASPHADHVAVGWAASAAALCSARTGRFGDVDALAARAVAAEHPGLLRFTSGFGRITALMMAAQLDEARALAQRYTDFAELQQPGRAIGEVLVAYVAIAQGDFDTAVRLLAPAADALAPTGYSWGPLSLMLLAQALGQQGERLDAAKALVRAESRHGLKSALFAPELALAKAWTKASFGDGRTAIDAARDAVQAAERGGQSAVALRALQDSARLGDIRAVYRAERLASEVNCALGRLTLAHARALPAGDADALREVSEDLAAVGLHPAAADAAAQADRFSASSQPVR